MHSIIESELGKAFFRLIPNYLKQLVEEKKKENEIREQSLYPYPDLCRRCQNKDTDKCLYCVPSARNEGCQSKRAIHFKAVESEEK